MKESDFFLLLQIAKEAGLQGSAKTSTVKLASIAGISQQSASRKLRELEKENLIERKIISKGMELSLTEKGQMLLKEIFLDLNNLFSKKQEKKLAGIVKQGLGEGKYYLSFPQYRKQFYKMLGFKPFLGTLNLVVDKMQLKNFLHGEKSKTVEGFETKERAFGAIECFDVLINNSVKGALIFPQRTALPSNEAEIIAAINLRKKFKLKDGSKIELKILRRA